MGAEKRNRTFFSRAAKADTSRENILSGLNCFQRLSAVDTCTFDCGHKLGAENRKI